MLAVGTKAPAFVLPDQNGVIVKANDKVKAASDPETMLGEIG